MPPRCANAAQGDRRPVVVVEQLGLGLAVVEDLQEEHPGKLPDPLGVAVDACVLAHDVLDCLDGCADGAQEGSLLRWRVEVLLQLVNSGVEPILAAELVDDLDWGADSEERLDPQDLGIVVRLEALVGVLVE